MSAGRVEVGNRDDSSSADRRATLSHTITISSNMPPVAGVTADESIEDSGEGSRVSCNDGENDVDCGDSFVSEGHLSCM